MYLNQISLQTIKIHFPKTFGQEYKGNLCIFLWKVTFSGSRKLLEIFWRCKEPNRSMSHWESNAIRVTPLAWIHHGFQHGTQHGELLQNTKKKFFFKFRILPQNFTGGFRMTQQWFKSVITHMFESYSIGNDRFHFPKPSVKNTKEIPLKSAIFWISKTTWDLLKM